MTYKLQSEKTGIRGVSIWRCSTCKTDFIAGDRHGCIYKLEEELTYYDRMKEMFYQRRGPTRKRWKKMEIS